MAQLSVGCDFAARACYLLHSRVRIALNLTATSRLGLVEMGPDHHVSGGLINEPHRGSGRDRDSRPMAAGVAASEPVE